MTDRDELEAIGSEGSLFLDDPWHCAKPVIELRREDGVERIEIAHEDSYRLELENLSDAIRGEAALLLGREDAVGQARALEALHAVGDGAPARRRSRGPPVEASPLRSESGGRDRRQREPLVCSPAARSTPTAPTRTSPSKTATPPRKNVKNGSKLARSTGSSRAFSASSRVVLASLRAAV